jgi:hypothetical protein
MCVDYRVGGLQLTAEQLVADPRPIVLCFDRNEDFMHTINCVWLRTKKQKKGWPSQISDIRTATRTDYPIQVADMLAWIINRNRIHALQRGKIQPSQRLDFAGSLDRYEAMFVQSWFVISHHMKWYDDPKGIIERYPNG